MLDRRVRVDSRLIFLRSKILLKSEKEKSSTESTFWHLFFRQIKKKSCNPSLVDIDTILSETSIYFFNFNKS